VRLASLDIGLKRIGLAITLDGDVVFPQNAIFRRETTQAVDEIKNFRVRIGAFIKLLWEFLKGGVVEEVMTRGRLEEDLSKGS